MSKGKRYRSEAMAAIHETMRALHKVGAVDKQTMRHFDEACLTKVQSLTPRQIKALRKREHVRRDSDPALSKSFYSSKPNK
jgi:putative transcriptional regulator